MSNANENAVGNEWLNLIEQGRKLSRSDTDVKWELGDLAKEVKTRYGEGNLQAFAEEIGLEYGTLKTYRTTAEAWQLEIRISNVPWTVHRMLNCQDDRHELIRSGQVTKVSRARDLVADRSRAIGDHKPKDRGKLDDPEPKPRDEREHTGAETGDESDKPTMHFDDPPPHCLKCPACGARYHWVNLFSGSELRFQEYPSVAAVREALWELGIDEVHVPDTSDYDDEVCIIEKIE